MANSNSRTSEIATLNMRLKAGGFDGLYTPGECACECSELAPCGDVVLDESGWINGCQPGYKHLDPRPGHVEAGDWAIFGRKEVSLEDWATVGY
jgi:hypothetical protein